jgi:hypothetical protein
LQASGSGGKAKGKAKVMRKVSDIDEDEDEDEDEAPAEKKAKRDPVGRCSVGPANTECQRCAKLKIPCADPDPSETRSRACEAYRKSKTRCIWESEDTDGRSMYRALQELTEIVDGNAEDNFKSQHEIKGSLHDLIQLEASRLRLQFGDAGKAEATRILNARKKRRAEWAAADKAWEKGQGTSSKD